ncbi:hypothetical protein PRUPE_4G285800 [Prunus persica]|uniref:Uncharacterized protein n=1 Tax=Prunus persica TaxID=3760 RepID=A0A251PSH8_PRUPE|nr:hypothetical protein PRUPE_4G285800 [Prunus persica]
MPLNSRKTYKLSPSSIKSLVNLLNTDVANPLPPDSTPPLSHLSLVAHPKPYSLSLSFSLPTHPNFSSIGPTATFDRSVLQILAPNKRVVLGEISNSTNNVVSTLNSTPKKPKSSFKKKKTTTKREEEALKTEIIMRSIDPRKSDHSPSIYCYLLS